jgi:hypothetical protein
MRPLLNLGDLLDATEDSLGAAREVYNTSSLENNNSGSTTVLRPLGAHDPSSLRQPTYRHRRPRANFESPNLNAPSTYRLPHLSHKGGEFTIHTRSDSEGSLAKDSDDEVPIPTPHTPVAPYYTAPIAVPARAVPGFGV